MRPPKLPTITSARRSLRPLLAGFVFLSAVLTTAQVTQAQYSWDAHFGPQQTGFEKHWFGNWEIEMLPLRGMINRSYYESDGLWQRGVRKIRREVTRVDMSAGSERVVHRSFSLVNSHGQITATVYLDPQTGKQVQRESFKYDAAGRLLEWRPVRAPEDVPVASIAETFYPERLPYGRYQTFRYHDDGTLKAWQGCTPGKSRRSQQCDDAYIKFDGDGRISEFIWLEDVFSITRDADGNVSRVVSQNRNSGDGFDMTIRYDDFVVREQYVMADSSVAENIVARDSEGRVVQYQIASRDTPELYSTVTWDYNAAGQMASIRRGLDTYSFEYDSGGNLQRVEQSVLPRVVARTFDKAGRLISQSPPLRYNRFDLIEQGTEKVTYDDQGQVSRITVYDGDGAELGHVRFSYEYYSSTASR